MKNKARLAVILYAVYALALVLIITFATDVSANIIYRIEIMFSKKNITDLAVDIAPDTELLAGKYYYPQYTVKGIRRGGTGLQYTSLDERLTVDESGRMMASTDFDGDSFVGRVSVTSYYDKDFEKVFCFTFVKKYPESFTVSYAVKGSGEIDGQLTVGVPVHVFTRIAPGSEYNVSDRRIIYDTEYFTEGPQGSLVPVRATDEGEQLAFTVEYGNGARASSVSFAVTEAVLPTDFDTVLLNGVSADSFVGYKGESVSVTIVKDGVPVATDYTLSLATKGDANRDGRGGMYFLTVGDKQMTVTLPGGYERTVCFGIRNRILLPTLKDESARQTHVLNVLTTDVKTYAFYFDGAVTYDEISYDWDSDMIHFNPESRAFTVDPRTGKLGTTEIRLVIDDGYTRVEDVYTVRIKRDMRIMSVISQNVSGFVSKVLGHMALFGVLAIVSMNMFKYVSLPVGWRRFTLYTLTGLSVAVLTELIQLFMPNRTAGVGDVIIDMSAFSLGTAAYIIVRLVVDKLRARKGVISDTDGENSESA